MQQIGALWLKQKGKKKFFSGVLHDLSGDISILIFKNDKKEGNQPDYRIMRADEEKGR